MVLPSYPDRKRLHLRVQTSDPGEGGGATGTASAQRIRRPLVAAKLREARFEDYAEIAALQLRNGLAPRSFEDWSALWAGNPAYLDRAVPIGWVLEGGEGIGGYLGNLPLDYSFRGRLVRAATDYSWVVDPEYRARSFELLYRFLNQPDVELFVCATPNATADKVLRAFEFARPSAGRWDRTGFWITNYPEFAKSALRAAGLADSAALSYTLGAALFLGDRFHLPAPRKQRGEFEICTEFDSRFSRFWEELKGEQSERLLADRSRSALQWHFRAALARKRAWVLAAARGERLVAYAVFDRADHPAIGLKRIRFTDFQALRGYEELLGPALRWMLDKCRAEDIHVAENSGCWLERYDVPGTRPPHHRRLQCWQFYYKTRNRELFRELQDPNVWAASSFDGDASL